jgi:asparagine synthase (glutamine-hydrolysing)
MGFAMPVGDWLRRPLKDQVAEEVVAAVRTHALFEPATVESWWRQHCSGLRDRSTELWALLVFNRWYRRFAAVSQGTEC